MIVKLDLVELKTSAQQRTVKKMKRQVTDGNNISLDIFV